LGLIWQASRWQATYSSFSGSLMTAGPSSVLVVFFVLIIIVVGIARRHRVHEAPLD
jgi:hypothetical protein